MRKRMIAALLAATLCITALSGCGDTGKQKESTDASKKGTEGTATEGSGDTGNFNAEGLPIVNEPYTFSIFSDDSSSGVEKSMMSMLEEQTGIKVDLQLFSYDIATEKLSLALSAGDYADVIGGWTLKDKDILTYGMDMGIFLPLEEYFEKYCPKITEILELEGVRETMTAPDGHIYSIPYIVEAPQVDFNPYINVKWLENLGLEVPTTTEEFREVLRAFKEQDANGNGDPGDEIPFSADADNLEKIALLCGWFGMSVDAYGFTMDGEELVYGANTEAYKEGIKFLNSLYEEGLIDPEIFTQDNSQWKAKGNADRFGVSIAYGSGDFKSLNPGSVPDYQALPVLSSEYCANPVWLRNSYGTTVFKAQAVITDNAEDPAAICRWWDNSFQFENAVQLMNGPIGTILFEEGDNYRAIDKTTLSDEDQKKYEWANLFPQSIPHFLPLGYKTIADVPEYDEKKVDKRYDQPYTPVDVMYEPYLTEKAIPQYWVSADDGATLSDLQTSIENYLKQKRAEWISGQADIDAEWDGYLAQLEKLNLQKYIDIRQAAIGQ